MDKILEEKHLAYVNAEIKKQIDATNKYAASLKKDIISDHDDFRDNRSATKYKDVRRGINEINARIMDYDDTAARLSILNENLKSAYFGSIVFDGDKFYIGKFGIKNSTETNVLVNDWRAPISSVFYEFELGKASYLCPMGLVEGDLTEKMQYKIEDGKLNYMFDTSVTIRDEILQQALAASASTQMKTIISTIQKKQNEIIRLPLNSSIVVQGVAGSGKTSIALHRIAYLLYNNRKNLTSKNILVFSPNNVFSSYIGSVLPELGEENVKEISFDDIFKLEFADVIQYEKRHNAIEKLLEVGPTKASVYKNSEECLNDINAFLDKYFTEHFVPKDVNYKTHTFSADTIAELVNNRQGENIFNRLTYVANAMLARVEVAESLTTIQSENLAARFIGALLQMLKQKNVFKIYEQFLASKNIKFKRADVLNFEDAINVLYVKNCIFGAKVDNTIKHVVIDEMQDYSPVALNIIKQMYNCSFTSLGDIYQIIDGEFSTQKLSYISRLFGFTEGALELKQNYRSTYEIASFANKILGIKFSEKPVRNGEEPVIIHAQDAASECIKVAEQMAKKHKTVGVICKTMADARALFTEFKKRAVEANLIRPESMGFAEGISVSAAHVVKGLEFDATVIYGADNSTYKTGIDRQSLYVAATRALHEIAVVYSGEITEFLK